MILGQFVLSAGLKGERDMKWIYFDIFSLIYAIYVDIVDCCDGHTDSVP